MPQGESEDPGLDLGRWLIVALVLLVGVVLYFWLAPVTDPVIPVVGGDSLP